MSSNVGSDQPKRSIADEAMHWLFEMDSSLNRGIGPTLERWLEFDAWLSGSPSNEGIYCRFEENLRRVQHLYALRRANPATRRSLDQRSTCTDSGRQPQRVAEDLFTQDLQTFFAVVEFLLDLQRPPV